jgi:hypothetical protein
VARSETPTPETRARKRAKNLSDLLWHAGTFVVINAFMWFIDIIQGGGLDWAFWMTVPWGIGLAFHALSYFIEERRLRKYQLALEEEQHGETPLQ